MGKLWAHILIATCLGSAVVFAEDDTVAPPPLEIVISVAEQKLALVKDGGVVRKYPISTSKFGLGDANNSYKTPLGRLRVCDKVGDNLPEGAVLKSRNATGEILRVNAPGRDPIVTRILWLDGLEACNNNARDRGIYIHGTVEESRLGQPVSYGCIRMRSRDVVELFDSTPVGTPVEIITDRLPRFRRAEPRPEILFASNQRGRTLFGERGTEPPPAKTNSNEKIAAEVLVGKLAAQPSKAPATTPKMVASAPAPIDGPNVVFTTPPPQPPQPNVVLSLKGSMLTADIPKAPDVDPVPKQPAASPVAETVTAPRNLVLQIVAPLDLLASTEETRQQMPLDHLSAYLLNPPSPQFRLAFRTNAEPPDL